MICNSLPHSLPPSRSVARLPMAWVDFMGQLVSVCCYNTVDLTLYRTKAKWRVTVLPQKRDSRALTDLGDGGTDGGQSRGAGVCLDTYTVIWRTGVGDGVYVDTYTVIWRTGLGDGDTDGGQPRRWCWCLCRHIHTQWIGWQACGAGVCVDTYTVICRTCLFDGDTDQPSPICGAAVWVDTYTKWSAWQSVLAESLWGRSCCVMSMQAGVTAAFQPQVKRLSHMKHKWSQSSDNPVTGRANAQTIHICHTYGTSSQSSPLHNHPLRTFDCFIQLYNRMAAQVLAFPWPCGLLWTPRSFKLELKCYSI